MRKPLHEYRLIGLTGTNGAGKGEVAAFLKSRGYAYISLSDMIREKLREEGKEADRNNLIQKGNELRRQFGPAILAKLVMERVRSQTVIDSIRNTEEVEHIRRRGGFLLVAVDAPVEIRFARVRERGRNESAGTLEEFIRKETEEKGNDPLAQQLDGVMAVADLTIINDGSIEDLHQKLEGLW